MCLPSSSNAFNLSASRISRSTISPSSVGMFLTLTLEMAAVSSAHAPSMTVALFISITSEAFTKATLANSRTTRSAFTPVRFDRSAIALSMRARISGFFRFSLPTDPALSGLYPARIAACVAFKSMRYSSQKSCCFLVIRHLTTSFIIYIGTKIANRLGKGSPLVLV